MGAGWAAAAADASALLDVAAPGELEQLVLHDNQLTQLFALETFTKLRSLDVSFNQLRSMAATAGLSTAQPTELFFAANKVRFPAGGVSSH
jgi:Leucine-rich repeat (LRR) protein